MGQLNKSVEKQEWDENGKQEWDDQWKMSYDGYHVNMQFGLQSMILLAT